MEVPIFSGVYTLSPSPHGLKYFEKCNIESKEYEIGENIVSKGIKSDENTLFSVMSEGKTVKQILQPSVRPLPFKKSYVLHSQTLQLVMPINLLMFCLYIYIYIGDFYYLTSCNEIWYLIAS